MTDSVLTHQGYLVKFCALKFTIVTSVRLMLHIEMLYFHFVAIPKMTQHHHYPRYFYYTTVLNNSYTTV